MRFIRLGAFLAWGAIASFAVAGFAAFNPAADSVPAPLPTTVAASPDQPVEGDIGLLAGRVAARTFSSTPAGTPRATDQDLLSAASRATVTTSASTQPVETPTTEPATTEPATTEPPTTEPPTTEPPTTAPPTTAPPTTAPPTTTTTVAAEPYVPAGTEGWVSLVEAFFAPEDVEQALMVMWCESRGNPDATNSSSGAAGLFQHLPQYWEQRSADAGWAGADIYDPTANVGVAAWLVYSGGGWSHWNPSAYCWG